MRIAILDNDSGFVQVLNKRLDAAGWEYQAMPSPVPFDAMIAMRLNAVVIDLAVLGPQAFNYLEKLCQRMPGLAVVVCTGPTTVAQRVRGLRLGADDWVTKPAHPEELIARVEAVVRGRRRSDARVEVTPVVAGELEVRPDQFQAFAGGVSVDLTRREFELIHLLSEAEGQVLPREEIYQRVWGYAMAHGDRSVAGPRRGAARSPARGQERPRVPAGGAAGRAKGQIRHHTPNTITYKLNKLQEAAGLELSGPHRLRHTGLTILASKGTNPYKLQKHARHSKLETTQGYVHLAAEQAAREVAAMWGDTRAPNLPQKAQNGVHAATLAN
jgi:DNA-binding response OmpR family regulator